MAKSKKPIRVLMADDHAIFRDGLRKLLDAEDDISIVGEASTGSQCIQLLGKLRPFTALGPEAQDAVLTECMTSRIETKRALFRGVRSLALLSFYGSAATRPLTGFPGPFGTGTVTIADAMRD